MATMIEEHQFNTSTRSEVVENVKVSYKKQKNLELINPKEKLWLSHSLL
jgi:hypothetical protein